MNLVKYWPKPSGEELYFSMHMISQSMAESMSMGSMEGDLLIMLVVLLWQVEVVDREGH